MKKKLLSLVILVVAICVSIAVGGGATSAFAADDARTEIINADYYANISRSMELHEQVVDKYKLMKAVHDGKDFDVYSDDYAGAFIASMAC